MEISIQALRIQRIKATEYGYSSALFPIILAFVLFGLFSLFSIWILTKSRSGTGFQQPLSPPGSASPPPPPSSSPFSSSSPKTGNQLSPPIASSPFSSAASPSSPTSPQLDQASAQELVQSWLNYKRRLFAPPYDSTQVQSYLVNPGPLYRDITRPGGSVDWLKTNQSYYQWNQLEILAAQDFQIFPDRAHIALTILEDLQLQTPRGIDRSKSSRKKQIWVYELKLDQGKWKVYDYRKDH